MKIQPVGGIACEECWTAYAGEHSMTCSKANMVTCPVCGHPYYTDRGPKRCTWDHTPYLTMTMENVA